MYAGCDLGTVTAKVVIIEDTDIVASTVLPYKNLPKQAAVDVFEKALSQAGLTPEKINYCVSTGFGKKAVSYADADSPEVICLNRAFRRFNTDVRTIIDVGGQNMRAVNINETGKVVNSTANEKCASGTGKFIEVMARALELSLDQVSILPFEATDPVSITNQCGVFAESEVITHVNNGKEKENIVAGIAQSVAGKVSSLVRRISLDEKVAMVGGVHLNTGVVKSVENDLGITLRGCKIR
jgi:predicted CoA-substrate-specific enzyme activase